MTPLQMAIAMCVIANGGKLMMPQIVKSITDDQRAKRSARSTAWNSPGDLPKTARTDRQRAARSGRAKGNGTAAERSAGIRHRRKDRHGGTKGATKGDSRDKYVCCFLRRLSSRR